MAKKQKNLVIGNNEGTWYITPDGKQHANDPNNDSSIIIQVVNDKDNKFTVDILFPNEEIAIYSKKEDANVAAQDKSVMQLLGTMFVTDATIGNVDFDDRIACINVELADDTDDTDKDKLNELLKLYHNSLKEMNDHVDDDDDDDDDTDDDDDSTDDDDDDDDDGTPEPPKPKRKPRDPDKEDILGVNVGCADPARVDMETYQTLKAIGGEEMAKHWNGYVWDDATKRYKPE